MPSAKGSHTIKPLRRILRSAGHHWVGDGFPVRTLFAYSDAGSEPFVMNTAEEIRQAMLDYQSGRMGRLS